MYYRKLKIIKNINKYCIKRYSRWSKIPLKLRIIHVAFRLGNSYLVFQERNTLLLEKGSKTVCIILKTKAFLTLGRLQ